MFFFLKQYINVFFSLIIVANALAMKQHDKIFIVGLNPMAIIKSSSFVRLGFYINERSEIGIPILIFSKKDDIINQSIGFNYIFHRNNTLKGKIIGAGLNITHIKWLYETDQNSERISKTLYFPQMIYGYRAILGNKIGVVSKLIGDYKIGKIIASDGTERLERTNSNCSLSFGFEIEYYF